MPSTLRLFPDLMLYQANSCPTSYAFKQAVECFDEVFSANTCFEHGTELDSFFFSTDQRHGKHALWLPVPFHRMTHRNNLSHIPAGIIHERNHDPPVFC
jgi:hypothetical protein